MRRNPRRRHNHVTLKECCHRVGCSSNSADGPNRDLVVSNSLFRNSQGACRIARVPLNPKVLGSIPGAGTNNAVRQLLPVCY